MKQKVTLTLDEDVIAKINLERDLAPISAYVNRMLRQSLKMDKGVKVVE